MVMKLLVVFGSCLILAASVLAQPTDANIHGLIGDVKRVDEKSSVITVTNGVRKEEKGNTEQSLVFDSKGRLTYETYSGMMNVTEIKYSHEKDGIRTRTSNTTRPFEKQTDYKRPSVSASRFTFDAKENSISEDVLTGRDFGGNFVQLDQYGQRYKYFFDDSNRMTKQVVMQSDGHEVMVYEYFYKRPGPPSDAVLSNRGQPIQFIKYTYQLDSVGNWTRRETETRPTNPQHPVRISVEYRKISYHKN